MAPVGRFPQQQAIREQRVEKPHNLLGQALTAHIVIQVGIEVREVVCQNLTDADLGHDRGPERRLPNNELDGHAPYIGMFRRKDRDGAGGDPARKLSVPNRSRNAATRLSVILMKPSQNQPSDCNAPACGGISRPIYRSVTSPLNTTKTSAMSSIATNGANSAGPYGTKDCAT